ncbi:hypothetical protein BAE44_0007077, partial [Dichanthelium oligosanthes]
LMASREGLKLQFNGLIDQLRLRQTASRSVWLLNPRTKIVQASRCS